MKMAKLYLLVLVYFLSIKSIWSHELSTAYINLQQENSQVSGEFLLGISDIQTLINMDDDGDSLVTWKELNDNLLSIQQIISQDLIFVRQNPSENNTTICPLQFDANIGLQQINANQYVALPFHTQCELSSVSYLRYELFFDTKPQHKAIVSIASANAQNVAVIDKALREIKLDYHQTEYASIFGEFLYQGLYHIAIGADHLLFVFILLLGVCFNRINGKWQMLSSKSTILYRSIGILSVFTLAHSITLTGMAIGLIPQFGAWIEVVIALSIIVTALNNLYPLIKSNHALVFGFGLIHGMGFAGALGELGVSNQAKLLSVLAFNLGVELGQVMFVLICLPLLLWAKNYQYYKLMPIFSSSAAVVASFWLFARMS